jgi:hypothetical protein
MLDSPLLVGNPALIRDPARRETWVLSPETRLAAASTSLEGKAIALRVAIYLARFLRGECFFVLEPPMLPNPAPYFANLPDPRRETKNKRFALCEILTIALCAIVSGKDDWKSVADFGQDKWPWFRHFLPLKYGVPSHDTFGGDGGVSR